MLAACFFLISYTLDCADGNFARKYNQVSKFGDYLDHISDSTKYTLLYVFIYLSKSIPSHYKTIFFVVTILFALLTLTHFGCQEKVYDKEESDSLYYLRKLCRFKNPKDSIRMTRYLGAGTYHLVVIVFLVYFAIKNYH
jgi:phosphatidylglycerophosphate synthase